MVIKISKVLVSPAFVVGAIMIMFLAFVIASVSVYPASFNVKEDVSSFYNITVNNTGAGTQLNNITQVNVSIPPAFTFNRDTNGTSAAHAVFVNTSTVLSWTNSTEGLVNGSINQSFWWNATTLTPGSYNFTIFVVNGTATLNYTITTIVNDTTAPSVTLLLPSNGSTVTAARVTINSSCSDNGVLMNSTLYLFNMTFNAINQTTALVQGSFNSTNWTYDLPYQGRYFWNKLCIDTYNNTAFNTTFGNYTFMYLNDTTAPSVTLLAPANNTYFNGNNTIFINASFADVGNGFGNVTLYLWNATFDLINTTTLSVSGMTNITNSTNNMSIILPYQGRYFWNYLAIDKYNNTAFNTTFGNYTFVYDTINPLVTIISPNTTTIPSSGFTLNITTSQVGYCLWSVNNGGNNFTLSTSDGISFINITRDFTTGTYTLHAYCNDTAGNRNETESVTFAINTTTSNSNNDNSNSGGGSGGGSSSPLAVWRNTVSRDDVELSAKGTLTESLGQKSRVKLKIDGQSHYVGVLTMTANSAVIEVNSTTQDATFNVGDTKKFDVNGNGYYELSVTLSSIVNGKANLVITPIHEIVPSAAATQTQTNTTGQQTTQTPATPETPGPKKMSTLAITIISIIILLIIVAIVALIVQSRKKK